MNNNIQMIDFDQNLDLNQYSYNDASYFNAGELWRVTIIFYEAKLIKVFFSIFILDGKGSLRTVLSQWNILNA